MSSSLLQGKRGIIFGALDAQSLAWQTAEQVYAHGGRFVLTNTPIALRMGQLQQLGEQCEAPIIPADATNVEELEALVEQAVTQLGGKLDFVLHSVAMSPNVRKNRSYGDLDYGWFTKTLDISALSFHKLLQTLEKQDALNEWASIVAISYIAAQRTFPGYSDMAQAKAMLESIARSYGERLGQSHKVRVNTVSQSPTKTTAGSGIAAFNDFFTYAEAMSPLGNASARDCANYVVTLFADLTRMVTMQNLYHDGGFSTTGVTEKLMEKLKD